MKLGAEFVPKLYNCFTQKYNIIILPYIKLVLHQPKRTQDPYRTTSHACAFTLFYFDAYSFRDCLSIRMHLNT